MNIGNYLISNLISKINYGANKRLRFIKVNLNNLTLDILEILYINGIIRSYRVENNNVYVYYKYYLSQSIFKLKIISKPGNRIFWTLNKLLLNYNNNNFSGFYIISTKNGLYTSDFCLNKNISGGEVLLKVKI
jgi:ribosomal protein S8